MSHPSGFELPDPHDGQPIAMDRSPVWLVNLPFMLGYTVLLAILGAAAMFAAARPRPIAPAVVCLFLLLLAWPTVILAYRMSMTAYTRLVIDDERLTWCEGIFTRRVISVELFRIQNAEVRETWWQRMAGFGTLILETSDAAYPLWILPGIPQVEPLREALIRYSNALRAEKGVREFNTGRV
jgi:membrane protein YdbS with pleckstrin-like domain